MSNNENSFKTQVELDIMLDRADNHDIETKKMNLRWNLEFEIRQYGLRSFVFTVPEQKVELSVCVWGDDKDTYEDVVLDIKDVKIEEPETFGAVFPKTLQYYKGKWTLVF